MDEEQVPVETSPETPVDIRPRRRRRLSTRMRGLIIVAASVVVVVGGFAVAQTLVSRAYDTTAHGLRTEIAAAQGAQTASIDSGGILRSQIDDATKIVKAAPAGSTDATAIVSLKASAESAASALAASGKPARAHVPTLRPKPFWLWDLASGRDRMAQETTSTRALAKRVDTTAHDARTARDTLVRSSGAVFASIKAAAARIEAANVSATTGTIVALRAAAAEARVETDLTDVSVAEFDKYVAAVTAAQKSERAELAEKAGPLLETRLAVEAFARSLSGGVLLDFNWAQTVLGLGYPGSMAGETSWDSDNGGTATILLSNSVAREWPDAASHALVAHEVGHAISAKCSSMFDWKSRAANEQWATAWAIGHGYTSDANGVQAYGYPPAALIEKSKSCR